MIDHFATLGLTRAPWVDAETLKDRFFRLGAVAHPDSGGSAESFAGVNSAWLTLRDPAECLRHYLELESPSLLLLANQTPPELGDLFMDIAATRQSAQRVAAKLATASSPLTRSLHEAERVSARARIASLSAQIATRLAAAQVGVREPELQPEKLVKQLSTMVFLSKWSKQMAETATLLESGSAG